MNRRLKKLMLLLLAVALLFGAGRMQHSLNHDRDRLGLTRAAVLQNAPPALAFTTVALGGFRGLISNFLWIRANDLQQDDKFFEAGQLADWITKLEPTFTQVWIYEAWNMAYNISVKFKENSPGVYIDRWNWLKRGIELLRDEGLRYNPNSILIYRELGWFFQHKMGQDLDDANNYYKLEWADEMTNFFGYEGTNFGPLLHPQTAQDYQRLQEFTNQYKMDPAFVVSVDRKYGPFDWLLPEAHAIYWGAKALDEAAKHPDKVKADDLITVRRIVYQSMLQAFKHGRIIADPFTRTYSLGPNLDLVAGVNTVYTNAYAEEADPNQKTGILTAQRNFLRDAIYFLYEADRIGEAQKWFNYLAQKFPNKPILDSRPDLLPKDLTLDEYAVASAEVDANETSRERVTLFIEGMLIRAYRALARGDDASFENYKNLTKRVYDNYVTRTSKANGPTRIPLMSFEEMNKDVLGKLLDTKNGVPYEARAVLRTQLGLGPEQPGTAGTAPGPAAPPAVNSVETNAASATAEVK
ncbi:MAG TPA: hypothetical protein VL970_13160 [Candidatus Acidoferrales bacterium]|nr:hypothetical protein [Candidatus Acidoferrales bacterium]